MTLEGRAQEATMQGIITGKTTGRPLEGANILLKEISQKKFKGAATDHSGYYHISGIKPGRYLLRISYVGYMTYSDTLAIKADQSKTMSVALKQKEKKMNQLVVSAHEGAGKVEAGRQHISSVDLGRVPSPSSEGDLASYLQSLPGIVATGDRGGQLYIRGGTPSQNLFLIDGNPVWQPFHILGYFSAFPQDLVSNVNFYAGGFGPRYSGRISSVIDVKMRDGNRNKTKGSASVSPFVWHLMAEGPLKKGKSSWIGSVQHSLIENTSPFLLGKKEPLRFGSQYLKVTTFGGSKSTCSVMGLHTYDRGQMDIQDNDRVRWSNTVVGGHCVALSNNPDLLFNLNLGVSNVWNEAGSEQIPKRSSSTTLGYLDVNLTRFWNKIRFEYGLFVHINYIKYDMNELFGGPRSGNKNLMTPGGYLETTIPLWEKLRIKPGVVLYYTDAEGKLVYEPRFRFNWQPWGTEDQELSGAIGLYYQHLTGITDKSGAGSIFRAWMPIPLKKSRMEALHMLLGWHQSLGGGFQVSLEGYYKRLRNIPVPIWSTTTRFVTDLAPAKGKIYGADFRLEFQHNPFYAFLGYGYSNTQYTTSQDLFKTWFGDATEHYHPAFDRRHQINAQFNMKLGTYTIGLGWEYGSGLPYTSPDGFDEVLNFSQRLPQVNKKSGFGTSRVLLGKLYQDRMPAFNRLDFSIKRSFHLRFGQLQIQAGAINVYDRSNLFYYNIYTQRRLNQLPIAPYISMKIKTI